MARSKWLGSTSRARQSTASAKVQQAFDLYLEESPGDDLTMRENLKLDNLKVVGGAISERCCDSFSLSPCYAETECTGCHASYCNRHLGKREKYARQGYFTRLHQEIHDRRIPGVRALIKERSDDLRGDSIVPTEFCAKCGRGEFCPGEPYD